MTSPDDVNFSFLCWFNVQSGLGKRCSWDFHKTDSNTSFLYYLILFYSILSIVQVTEASLLFLCVYRDANIEACKHPLERGIWQRPKPPLRFIKANGQ
jgi:hypothetical protein